MLILDGLPLHNHLEHGRQTNNGDRTTDINMTRLEKLTAFCVRVPSQVAMPPSESDFPLPW